jgi:hypothetical protein
LALLRLFAYAFVIDFHFFISFISYFRHWRQITYFSPYCHLYWH